MFKANKKYYLTRALMVCRAKYLKKGGQFILMEKTNFDSLTEDEKNRKKKLIDSIKNIDSFLKFSENPEKEEYQSKVQYLEKKDDSQSGITEKAQESLQNYKLLEENKINQKAENDIGKIQDRQGKVVDEYEQKQNVAKDSFADKKEKANQELSARGLGRSSIMQEKGKDIDEEEEQTLNELKASSEKAVIDLQKQVDDLEKKRDQSLSNFAIEYAIKLQDKIDKLTNDIASYNTKITQYNNALSQKDIRTKIAFDNAEKDKVDDNEKRNKEIVRFLNKYGYGNYNSLVISQKMKMVEEFLNSLDKQNAIDALLEDNEIRDLLGDTAFNLLLQKVQEREE